MPESSPSFCVYCSSPVEPSDGGILKCERCGRSFEVTASGPAGPLDYSTPATEAQTALALDPYCKRAFRWSLISWLFPAIGIYAFGLASAGYVRAKEQQRPGARRAILAMALSGAGLIIFGLALYYLNQARVEAETVICMSNIRQVAAGISAYEQAFPGATNYSLEDVVAFSKWKYLPRCPLDPVDPQATARKRSTSYILLTHLEPFSTLPMSSTTPIAFEIASHRWGTAGRLVNVSYADGHTECLPLADALDVIQSAIEMTRPAPATAPTRSAAR